MKAHDAARAAMAQSRETRIENAEPVYTTPPKRPWVGLTAQEVAIIAEGVYGSTHHDDITFVMEIQVKLKEKNT